MIPKQLKHLSFCRILKGNKAPFQMDWVNKPLTYEEISKFFPKENYGVLCGYHNLAVIDCDKEELKLAVEQLLPKTFSVKTGGGGMHFYYFVPDLKKKIILNAKEEHLGEIQSYGSQVVGAGSTHPNGKEYEVINNSGITEIPFKEIEKTLGKFMKKEEINFTKKEDIEDYNKLIEEIVKIWKEGDRQELSLSVAGYLRKEKRLGINKVKSLIKKVCEITKDNETNMRLRAVDETFKKDEKDIKGFTGLDKKIDWKKEIDSLKEITDPDKALEILKKTYKQILGILKEYLDMDEKYYPLVSIWIIGTWIHKEFETYPYLYINAMRGSGKTRLLKLIAALSKEGEILTSLSEAVLFRGNETLCIDEFERVAGKEKANLRELLNVAYKKGAKVKRMRKTKQQGNENYEVEAFNVFRPVAMANIWGIEEVLGDRCISIILERSQKKEVIRLIENFSQNPTILEVKNNFLRIWCSLCSVVTYKQYTPNWNNYIKNTTKSNTETTLTTHNTYNTDTTLTTQQQHFFDKIERSQIDGRNLELAFPLFMIAEMIGEKTLDDLIHTIECIIKERKIEESTESRDMLVYDFISQQEENDFISMIKLTNKFREFIGEEDQEGKWINTKWLGRALKRLSLYTNKRRMGHGIEVTLNIPKAKQKIKMFK